MYVDAVCYYRPSSVVCCCVTVVSPAKTAEPNEMDAIWVVDSGGLKEACIRWGPDPP